jgi:titin
LTTTAKVPVAVSGVSGISKIAPGSDHTCALLTAGSIRCWGNGSTGELGNGTTTTASNAVTVTGISTAIDISSGPGHSCAVLTDGSVRCWGYGQEGQLGNGTNVVSQTTPVQASGVSGARMVSAGYYHSCSLDSTGLVKCWGAGGAGQLGTGTTAYSSTPVPAQIEKSVIPGVVPGVPTGLVVTGKSQMSVSLSWVAPVDDGGRSITDYKVEHSVDGSSWSEFAHSASTNTSITVTGLTRGVSRQFRVSAVNGEGSGEASSSVTEIPASVPAAPTALAATSKTATSLTIDWTAPDDGGRSIVDYVVRWSVDGSSWTILSDGVSTATSATISGLTRGVSYQVQVSALNAEGQGSQGSLSAIPAVVPGVPTGLVVTGKSQTSVSLSWVAPVDNGGRSITDYKVEHSVDGSSWSEFAHPASANTSITVTGLTRGVSRQFRVSAVNAEGSGEASSSVTEIAASVPAAPTALVATSKTATSLTIGWSAPDDGGRSIVDYVVRWSVDGSSWTTLSDGVSIATSATISGLTRGVSYQVQVSALNAEGQGSQGSLSAIPAVVPGVPTGLVVTGKSQTSVSLSWVAPVDNGGRTVGDYLVETSIDGNVWNIFSDQFSALPDATVSGLTRGTTYQFRVSALNAEGAGSPSSAVSTIPASVPSVPGNFRVTGKTANSLGLEWSEPDNGGRPITDYVIRYSADGTNWLTHADGLSTSTSLSIGALSRGVTYSIRVAAVNAEGASSEAALTSIPAVVPGAPTGLSVTGKTQTSIALSWSAPVDNGGRAITDYQIEWSTNGSTWNTFTDGVSIATSATVTGLTRSLNYEFKISAKNPEGAGPASSALSAIPATSPATPTSLIVASKNASEVNLTWSAPDNGGSALTDYLVTYSSDGTNWTTANRSQSLSTAFTIGGLTRGIQYSFKVAAINIEGTGAAASISSIPAVVPSVPASIETYSATRSSVNVRWLAPDDGGRPITDYRVRYSIDGTNWTTLSQAASTAVERNITGLSAGLAYQFQVAAVTAEGQSGWSTPASAITAVAPGVPGLISISSRTTSSISLAWSAPVSSGDYAVTDYKIEYSTNGTTWESFTHSPSVSTNATITGLTRGTAYRFRVAALSAAGSSNWTTTSAPGIVAAGVPSGSTELLVTNRTQTSVSLSWVAPVDNGGAAITDYVIRYSVDGLTWSTFADGVSTSTTAVVTGLTRGSLYRFRVAAVNDVGVGPDAFPRAATSTIIGTGSRHGCAVNVDLTARCWGANNFGQLGDGSTTESLVPVAVSGLSNVVSISAGGDHSCAVMGDGTARCWGQDGWTTGTPVPIVVSGLSNAMSVSTGQYHSCFVLGDGTAQCRGFNSSGQLGDGSSGSGVPVLVPVVVSGLSNVVSITAGGNHSCAVLRDQTVRCWGLNSSGQLGNGSTTSSSVPVVVSGLSNVVSISAGSAHSCAVLADGTARCWGFNSSGQLGNGVSGLATSSSVPVVVSGLSNVVSISAGDGYSCAVVGDGTARCWGRNVSGALGDGSTTSSSVPVVVSGLSNVVSVSAGSREHSCAVLLDGTARCWGYNQFGQLGNGTQTDSSIAAVVTALSTPGPDVLASTSVSAAPTGVVATGKTATSVSLGWLTPVDNGGTQITDYLVQYSPDGVVWSTFVDGVSTSLSATVTGLTRGTSYQFRVRAVNAGGPGAASSTVAAIPAALPGAPSGLLVTTKTGSSVSLSWVAPVDNGGREITDYLVQYSTDGAAWSTFVDGVSTSLSATVTGLTRGTSYQFRVVAVTPEGSSPASSSVSSVPSTVPATPSVSRTAKSDNSITVGWSIPDNGGLAINGYRVEISTDGSNWMLAESSLTWTSKLITGLDPRTNYRVRVAALNENGTGAWGLATDLITDSVPFAPTSLQVVAGDGSVQLGWVAGANGGSSVTDHEIAYTTDGSNWTIFSHSPTTASSLRITGLTNGVDYRFRVRAINTYGAGDQSANSPVVRTAATPLATVLDALPQTLRLPVTSADAGESMTLTASGFTPNEWVTFAIQSTPQVLGTTQANGSGVASMTIVLPTSLPAGMHTLSMLGQTSGLGSRASLSVGSSFFSVTPVRVFDTRPGQSAFRNVTRSKVGGGYELRVKVTDVSGAVPASGVGAVSLNVTVTEPDAAGYVTVYPCGSRPNASSLNYTAGQTIPNAVVTAVSAQGEVCFYSQSPTHLLADVNGWFAAGAGFTPASPVRVFDTRPGQSAFRNVTRRKVGGGYELRVKVTDVSGAVPASGVGAVSLNVTVTEPDAAGYVTVYPCGSRPNASSLNYTAGQTIPNAVVTAVSAQGEVCFYSQSPTHLLADVNGWFN